MSKHLRYKHALHNRDVCSYIDAKQQYSDWVVTTAFYSALQFVKADLFPLKVTKGGKTETYNSFEDFYNRIDKNNCSKHESLIDLIYEHRDNLGAGYEFLYDLSMTSRYKNYILNTNEVDLAKKNLSLIELECKANIEAELGI